MSSTTTKESLDLKYDILLDRLITVKAKFTLHETLVNYLSVSSKYNDVYEMSPAFWTITINALESDVLFGLAKMCDGSKGAVSIRKIIDIVNNNRKIYYGSKEKAMNFYENEILISDIISRAASVYDSCQSTRTKLKALRDKHFAHTDKEYIGKTTELYELNHLTFDEIADLIESLYAILDLLKTFGFNINSNHNCPTPVNIDDVYSLVDNASIGKKQRKAYYSSKNEEVK